MVVYSRWCGELISDIQHCGAKRGLSPLARGTLILFSAHRYRRRFIPAGAGNSNIPGDNQPAYSVYPRWRGELSNCSLNDFQFRGLSPLARGTQRVRHHLWLRLRFIPAGAGNSCAPFFMSHYLSVYPRWRGELLSLPSHPANAVGLSPLARGTH